MTALATATSAQANALNALFEAATVGLSSEQRTRLMRIYTAQSWGLPPEFGVVERNQSGWVDLRDALANERFSAKYGEEPVGSAVAYLANARADASVAAARTGLDTNLAGITAAWNAALEN